MKHEDRSLAISNASVQSRIIIVRDMPVIVDADVAEIYGVETKRVNEAVRNNPDKFPEDYMFVLSSDEFTDLRSKISTTRFVQREYNLAA